MKTIFKWILGKIIVYLLRPLAVRSDHIIFAAHARCNGCNAGLGYKANAGIQGEWDCSAALLGEVERFERNEDGTYKHPTFPFAFYEMKSEDQNSANGRTTRPDRIKKAWQYELWNKACDFRNSIRD